MWLNRSAWIFASLAGSSMNKADNMAHRAKSHPPRAGVRLTCLVVASLIGLSAAEAMGLNVMSYRKQVFPPRSGSSTTAPLSKVVPFATLLGGDLTKSFIQITNIPSPGSNGLADSNFVIGHALAGRLNLAPHISDAGGNKVFFFVKGLSNPPTVSSEGNELHFQFVFPTLQIKGYYKDFSTEGDLAMGDAVSEKVQVDVFITPATNHLGFPTYHSAHAVFKGELKVPEKCTYWVGIIFPVNMCDLVTEYLKQIKPAIENGIRDSLQQTNTRLQFDQAAAQYLLADLRKQAGLDPASPAQLQIVQTAFQGTDYVVSYRTSP